MGSGLRLLWFPTINSTRSNASHTFSRQQCHIRRTMAMITSFIDSNNGIVELLDSFNNLIVDPPSLYFDLEGIELSRTGSISIFSLFVHPDNRAYLIDVNVLGQAAFSTPGSDGKTLQHILESPTIPKVCFDVRNDSDALYHHFQIALQGIQDVQLMENASRSGPISNKKWLQGLAKCITKDVPITQQEKEICKKIKDKGRRLFAPERGGAYAVFNERPLREEIKDYCVQDVQFLPKLCEIYRNRLNSTWKIRVEIETLKRVQSSQSPTYLPHGNQQALGPWKD